MADDDSQTITVYSDYVCPFCFLGRRSLDRYRERRDDPLTVEWHPFDLRADRRAPDGTLDPDADDGKDEAYYERARENVERLSEEYDVDMARTLIRDVDSWNAQLVSLHVQSTHPESWEAFDRAVFDALWQAERDVGDLDVLVDLATAADLDPAVVETALADDELERQLDERFEAARARGIRGVPTFVTETDAVSGAIPADRFGRLFGD